jgi:superfamily II DNA/RNA helicase
VPTDPTSTELDEAVSVTFASLGVADDLVEALSRRGINEPFEIQTLTIPDALAGRDVCGKAKTGSGKTLAFGIPAIERLPPTAKGVPNALVLVPTRELAVQVADELEPLAATRNRRVEAIYGGADMDRQIQRLAEGVDVVVATPGRMIDLIDRGAANVAQLKMVVVDEADRMADMGFLPQVEWILRHVEGAHETFLFSATLYGEVGVLVDRYQRDPVLHEVIEQQVTVDRMHLLFLQVHQKDAVKVTATIAEASNRTLVFCNTKRSVDRVVEQLREEGITAAAIHGDLRQKAREQALERFSKGKLQALVATDVAARGIHVDDVDVVVHYDPTEDAKTYLHRSGRTARAGESGVAVTLVRWDEEMAVRQLQRRLGLKLPIVEVFSNDERLRDLAAWHPASNEGVGA